MAFGVTDEGFVKKTYEDIIEDAKTRAKMFFGDDVDLSATSPLMQFIESIAMEMLRMWNLCEEFYYSGFVDYASGISLDRVCELIGVYRKSATKASGIIRIFGDVGTFIPQYTTVQTETEPPITFQTQADATIPDAGYVDVEILATDPGSAGNVAANTITYIEPISGVTSVTNPNPTTGGSDLETDADLRYRAKKALEEKGLGTLEAIKMAVLGVPGVTDVLAEENLELHKVQLWVAPPGKFDDADVINAVEKSRPAGIMVELLDTTYAWIWVRFTIDLKPVAPVDANDRIREAIINYINGVGTGKPCIYTKLIDAIYDEEEKDAEPWINDITLLEWGKGTATTPPTTYITGNLSAVEPPGPNEIGKSEIPQTDETKVEAV